MFPKSLNRINEVLLKIEWNDGLITVVALESLREECPCAVCKGENIMGKLYFPGMKSFVPGMNELVSLTPVGNYGVQALWKDGHSTGIYSWEGLRTIAELHALDEENQKRYSELKT
ncbi:hypothetical protein MASR2M18_04930 [Ignavibacteria bacterium]|jgi:DUF971 family protein|nr:DUF971 domain-containing protein [Bacteroidota bacterium]MCZ2131946.1 DUF971 domain-containing protein [Bacteroidota bacterium]